MTRNWALLGMADHQGIFALRGRAGASQGPNAFRKAFSQLKDPMGFLKQGKDFGDVAFSSDDLEKKHEQASKKIQALASEFDCTVVVGGTHDYGYAHLKGIEQARTQEKIGCFLIDAHFDMRDVKQGISSGSAFYLAFENHCIAPEAFVAFGVQRFANSKKLWDYARSKKVLIYPFETVFEEVQKHCFQALRALSQVCDRIVVSFDLDAVEAASAPGVSAAQALGFSSRDIFQLMRLLGSHPRVCSLGVFELNPEHDLEGKTAQLAAVSVFSFLQAAFEKRVSKTGD